MVKKIAILTSGGDAPGMNAAIRAVVRASIANEIEAVGVTRGYQGLISGDFKPLTTSTVSNIIQRGGTILKSARSEEFRTPEGRKKAAENLYREQIDALVLIGGDGTFTGGHLLSQEHGIKVVGIPGTIDNDLIGTDETIGYDTALNTAIDAIDKIRDTADAHERLFLVEVMGRDTGFIALETGIASGAELILLPEQLLQEDDIRAALKGILKEQKRSSLVVVAEGEETGGALKLAENLKDDFSKYELRVCILGHIQRGGNPTSRDRVLASRLGASSVYTLLTGTTDVMVGIVNNEIVFTPLKEAISRKKTIDFNLLELAKVLR